MADLIPYVKSNSTALTANGYLYVSTNGGSPGLFDSQVSSYTLTRAFFGFKQPGWRDKIRRKENATTPASGSKETLEIPWSENIMKRRLSFNGNEERFVATGNVAANLHNADLYLNVSDAAPINQTDNMALSAFLRKCKSKQRQLMAGVFLGELRQTLNLIHKPAVGLRRLYDDYAKACRRVSPRLSPKKTLEHLSGQWLEYSFGMVPLASDIEGGYEALKRLYFNLPTKYVKAFVNTDYDKKVDTTTAALWSQYFPIMINRSSTASYKRTWRGEVKVQMQGIGQSPKTEAFGFTVRDFIPTVYELIPYSFLVDYFVNIGEILDAASFNQADLVWNCSTGNSTKERIIEVRPDRPSQISGGELLDWSVMPGRLVHKIESFSRHSVPAGTLGLPSLAVRLPNKWNKQLNIAALATLRVLR